MARPLRIEFPGAIYHVTSRGNDKKVIFMGDSDRDKFLKILTQVNKKYRWICHAYCLMDNHYHLLIETPEGNLSLGMKHLNGVYTQMVNLENQKTGHLFQGRFKAILIQKESHLLEVCRYVVLNPVRARMVKQPGDWKWSSYMPTVGKCAPQPCLTTKWILSQFGRKIRNAEKAYLQFVGEVIGDNNCWADLKNHAILGDEKFVDKIKEVLKGNEAIPEIQRSQRFLNRPTLERIFSPEVEGDKFTRNKKIVQAVYEHGYKQREIADHLGLFFTSVSRIIGKEMARK
jgi:putative transposase